LLQKGANPNLADRKGVTPLMLATQLGFIEGAERLIKSKARSMRTNRSGETALIRAVQLRNPGDGAPAAQGRRQSPTSAMRSPD
jgi:hypothetical protein